MDHLIVKDQHHESQPDHWVHMDPHQSPHINSPSYEFNGYSFIGPSSHQNISGDSTYHRVIPQQYSPQSPHSMSTAQWPSQLTHPSTNHSPLGPHHIITPVSSYPMAHSLPPLATPAPTPTARRTLTDQDRRRMCEYHEQNPSVKQTEIGAIFGVERSTVSKVLRQKEKYLYPEDGSRSPVKRPKGKFPDIERALANWAKNHQRQGLLLTDNIIREKARFFAATVGNSESHTKLNGNTWLEKFKQKNHLMGAKPRKGSEGNDSDGGNLAGNESGSQTPNDVSPISPVGTVALPVSRGAESIKTEDMGDYMDVSPNYKHGHSQSATSVASQFSDTTAPSSFSPQSPMSPFFSSHGYASNSYLQSQYGRAKQANGSHTFQDMMESPVIETTPVDEMPEHTLGGMSDLQRMMQNRPGNAATPTQNSSPSVMAPPPLPSVNSSPTTTSNVSSPLGPPSQDEARRALELVMSFFKSQPNTADAEDFVTIGRLMQKLKINGAINELPGGMHSIDQELSRKRSIHSL